MPSISDRLDAIFEETSVNNPIGVVMEIVQKLDAAKQLVLELQDQLTTSKRGMSGDLALGIRRQHPSLHVGVDDNGCKAGYKHKHLLFSPDLDNSVWSVSSPDTEFSQKFEGDHIASTGFDNPTALVNAIITYFSDHFKALGEDLVGEGCILVEGKRGNSLDVVIWKDCCKPRLMSRKTRALWTRN